MTESDSEEPALRVMVVDDRSVNLRVMETILLEFGHRVALVDNGRDAIERAAAEAFDLIVVDYHMPHLDGDETTRRIRAAGASKASFVVQWTTDETLSLNGALYDAALSKPVRLEALERVLYAAAWRRGEIRDRRREPLPPQTFGHRRQEP